MAAPHKQHAPSPLITISLCGDVMTGRGVDQILPHPSAPVLYEPYVKDARGYVELAERANGPIPQPVDDAYVWGEVLKSWDDIAPDLRVINLETSVTRSNDAWPGKGIHYRMHPQNVRCITSARIDCCSLANNHVLDWGYAGLAETLQTLRTAGVKTAGAGADRDEAEAPAVLDVPGKGRVLLVACGSQTSGVPAAWAAGDDRAGIQLFDETSERDVQRIGRAVAREKGTNDVVVASVHWGGNWGYEIPDAQKTFAHALVDQAGVDVVYGHSSHHPKAIEVYRGRLILYGCGDFLDDYEGISGYESFRDDLGLIYSATIDAASGCLSRLDMLPTQIRRMQLHRATAADAAWLRDVLDLESHPLGGGVELTEGAELVLKWDDSETR